jgi:serine/threonine protein kinase
MCDATSLDGTHVVLKIVDDKTDELKILKYLNDIKSAANHTIELHGTILNSIANVVALRWRIPLEDYFSPPTPELASFPEQFLEAVAFLHERGVAHMDLKPGNVVVDGMDRDRPPRILIIDFDLSIFVEGEDTMTEGFCGTPPWIAPEVGMPNMKYSAILADRWACGRMVCYLQERVPPGCDTTNWTRDAIQERIRSLLMSDDPRSRRPLKNVLEAYRRGSVKRIAAKAEEGEETRKRARASVSLYVCHRLLRAIINLSAGWTRSAEHLSRKTMSGMAFSQMPLAAIVPRRLPNGNKTHLRRLLLERTHLSL